MSIQNYSINTNKAPFSMLDDDDADITSAFMNSSSATYLAADKIPPSFEHERFSQEECKRDNLLQQIKCVEQRTLDSSKRSLGMLVESEVIGVETAQDLAVQRDQLERTKNRLVGINSDLKDTQKNINGIKSVFSSIQQWWASPKQRPAAEQGKSSVSPAEVCSSEKPNPVLSKNLASAVEDSKLSLEFSKPSPHPALRLKGLEDDEDDSPRLSEDFRVHTQRVNQRLDEDLTMMSSGLSRLKELAQGLNNEITDHNELIDGIQTEADNADLGIQSQNKQMNRILKR